MAKKRYKPVEKKEKKNWWALVILVFMVVGLSSSFLFFGFRDSGSQQEYNGYEFVYRENTWQTTVDGVTHQFLFPPGQVNTIRLSEQVKSLLDGPAQLDSTSAINDTFNQSIALAQYQMTNSLIEANVYPRVGFTTNVSSQFPMITCADATSSAPVVYFKGTNSTSVTLEGSCIVASGQSQTDIVRIKDRLMYQLLGVME